MTTEQSAVQQRLEDEQQHCLVVTASYPSHIYSWAAGHGGALCRAGGQLGSSGGYTRQPQSGLLRGQSQGEQRLAALGGGQRGQSAVFNIMSLLMADKSSLAVDPQTGWVFDYWHCAADRAFRRFCWHQQHADQWSAPHFQRLAAAH